MRKLFLCLASVCAVAWVGGVASAQEKKLPEAIIKATNTNGKTICDLVPGNVVLNCGFETGDFTSWRQSGDLGFTGVSIGAPVHSGRFGAFFGPIEDLGFITQLLETTPDQSYDISFWLRNAGFPNRFQLWWNGALVEDDTDVEDFGYAEFGGSGLIATATLTELVFGFYNVPDYFYLDDVVVVPTPE